jgi:uncharacterized protein (DUF2141 family)
MFLRTTLLFSLCGAAAAGAMAASVEVHVAGVTAGKGKVKVALCDQEHFLKQCGINTSVPADGAEVVVTMKDVPEGSWAVLAYQDVNENNELDRNKLGIPTERYGFSREARGKFGPPKFPAAAIEVQGELTVAPVKLK